MRWSPVLLAAFVAASLPRLAAAQTPDSDTSADADAPGTENDATAPAGAEGATDSSENQASGTSAAPHSAAPAEDDEAEPTPVEPALDTLGGHIAISPSAALVLPFGELAQGTSQNAVLGSGPGFGLELGYGVSRTVMLGVWGNYARLGGGSDCASCSASALSLGPFIRYHLVQGVRFDPWLEAGLGFRSMSIDNPGKSLLGVPSGSSSWSGIQWLRLAVGGDWYAFSKVGFGPFMALDMTTLGSRPATAGSSSQSWQLSLGARITFDLPGK
jgi:hypothetical protein